MRVVFSVSLALIAASAVAGCDQLGLGPQRAASAPATPPTTASELIDLRAHAGETYAQFQARPGMERYTLAELGLSQSETERFQRSMAQERGAPLVSGGGVEALVFSGCAAGGCLDGLSVLAIDVSTGEVFVGVSDMAGIEKPVPNDRLEVLLRLTSPSQSWDDPVQIASAPEAAQP